jgi:enoyl-CoA hydratase
MSEHGVRVRKDGDITIVSLDRPQAHHAVDGPTAFALASEFEAFDADASSPVAILYGEHAGR